MALHRRRGHRKQVPDDGSSSTPKAEENEVLGERPLMSSSAAAAKAKKDVSPPPSPAAKEGVLGGPAVVSEITIEIELTLQRLPCLFVDGVTQPIGEGQDVIF